MIFLSVLKLILKSDEFLVDSEEKGVIHADDKRSVVFFFLFFFLEGNIDSMRKSVSHKQINEYMYCAQAG